MSRWLATLSCSQGCCCSLVLFEVLCFVLFLTKRMKIQNASYVENLYWQQLCYIFFSNVYVCKIGRALRQFLALDTSSIKMLSELLSELLCRWDKGRIYTRGSTIWGPQNSHLIKTSQCFVLRIHSTVQNSAYCTSPLY